MDEPPMARARRLAREQKLKGICYFNKNGKTGARGKDVALIELQFSNGESVTLTPQELAILRDVKFDLQRSV